MKGQDFSRREAVKTFVFEIWAILAPGQLFSIFNEWIKRLEYVIESEGEYYTE
jgi:hypothetical protein